MVAAKPRDAGNDIVTLRLVEIAGDDAEQLAYQYAATLQQLNHVATHADTTRAALRLRIINQLRKEGLDASAPGIRGVFGGASDAVRVADSVVQPLSAITTDCENAARNAHVFERRIRSQVFDAIRIAREQRNHADTAGLIVR